MLTSCTLCPRRCSVDRTAGERGFCGAGDNIKIARAALHMWEEPCISGTRGSGTVFFSACNMKCIYCQNYEISSQNCGREISEEKLAQIFLSLEREGAHNINLVTPTHYVPAIISALDIAKKNGLCIPVVYNCGGYECEETIELLKGYVDIYIPDIKYYSDKYALEYSGAPRYFETAMKAVSAMVSQVGATDIGTDGILKKGVIIRHLMLPGLLFDTKKIVDAVSDTFGDKVLLSIMSQYTPMPNVYSHPKLCKKINPEHYNAMIDYIMCKGMDNIFVQDISSADEAYIPDFDTVSQVQCPESS